MKKIFWIAAAVCLGLAIVSFLRTNTLVANFLESVIESNDKMVIVIDPGHPATSLGTENKTRPCVSMGDAL